MKTTGIGTEQTMADTKSQTETGPQVVTRIAPAAPAAKKKMTVAEVRAKLDGKTGRRFWKNLDELAETSEFQELMQQEFPRQAGAGEWVDAVSRRGFLKVMGASFALAGLAGYWLAQAAGPPSTASPHRRQHQLYCGRAALAWLHARRGWA